MDRAGARADPPAADRRARRHRGALADRQGGDHLQGPRRAADAGRRRRMLGHGPPQLPAAPARRGSAPRPSARASSTTSSASATTPRSSPPKRRPSGAGGCGRCRSATPPRRWSSPTSPASVRTDASMSSSKVRCASSRTIDSIQKKLASRAAARDRLDAVERGRGVEDHVPRLELDAVRAVAVLDHQLAAVIIGGIAEEERRRDVGADPPAAGQGAKRIVDMLAEAVAVAGVVAVEQGRDDPPRQRRRLEQGIARQAREGRSRPPSRAASPSLASWRLCLASADWTPAVTRPSRHSPAAIAARTSAELRGVEERGNGDEHRFA